MIEALSAELSLDLRPFSRYLSTQGVRHQISEESGKQVLRVVSEPEAEAVRRAFALWREQPELLATLNEQWERQVEPRTRRGSILNSLFQQAWMMPITFLLTVLCLLVAAFSGLGRQLGSLEFLLYPLLDSSGFFALLGDIDSLSEMLRTLTPMLLHFGELHLVFNLLWLWYFGKQIEPRLPFVQYGALILLLAFASNTAEYLVLEFNNFGGMSGVVCGLVSCAWVIQSLMPRSRLMISHSMFAGFIIIIIAMEVFAGAYIATAAHVGGLVAGLLLGLVLVTYHRLVLKKSVLSR
jgi:GlpG protein